MTDRRDVTDLPPRTLTGVLGGAFALGTMLLALSGCAGVALFGIPLDFTTTEILPRAVNGKGLAEDGADLATGKDCRIIEGTVRKDRKVCEPRGSPATKKDFKGLSGLSDDAGSGHAPAK